MWVYICRPIGDVAQLVEQWTENPCVGGSIPSITTQKPFGTPRGFLLIIASSPASNEHNKLVDCNSNLIKQSEKMHPLKKDEYRIVNRIKFEMKNVLEHVVLASESDGRINQVEVERRLNILREFTQELAHVQNAIDSEIEKHTA